jgi:hypothetical protein
MEKPKWHVRRTPPAPPARPAARRTPRRTPPRPPGTGPVPGSAAAAVHAALTASPGATTAAIADAGVSRPAARDALAALEAVGEAARTRSGRPGIADTWTLAAPGPLGTEPAGPGHDDDHAVTGQRGADRDDIPASITVRWTPCGLIFGWRYGGARQPHVTYCRALDCVPPRSGSAGQRSACDVEGARDE